MTNNTLMPAEYKDILYRITYSVLGKVAPIIPRSINPNHITYAAFVCSCIACLLLYVINNTTAYLYWALFNFIWYLLDALDGIHARRTQQTSEYGGFLDHLLDNIYFIFMFTVFIVKFHLLYPLYLFIIIMRITAATVVFLAQVHTGKLYLSKCSGGLELVLMTAVMFLSFLFPNFNLVAITQSGPLYQIASVLHLDSGVFMKLALLIYLVGVPVSIIITTNFVKTYLSSQPTKE